MIQQLEQYLSHHWDRSLTGIGKPPKLSFLLSKKYKKLRYYVFAAAEKKPIFFVKTVRFKTDNAIIAEEERKIRAVSALLPPSLRVVPPPIYRDVTLSDRKVLVYRYIEGETREASRQHLTLETFPYYFEMAARRATAIGAATSRPILISHTGSNPFLSSSESNTKSPAGNGNTNGSASAFPPALDNLRQELEFFHQEEQKLPTPAPAIHIDIEKIFDLVGQEVLVHGDYGVNNFLFPRKGEFYLTDWEFSPGYGLPLEDLLFFIVHYSWYYCRDEAKEYADETDPSGIINHCFIRDTPTSRVISREIREYCRVTRIHVGDLLNRLCRDILMVALMRVINHCHRQEWAAGPLTTDSSGNAPGAEWRSLLQALARIS